jgi:hypothetical protein
MAYYGHDARNLQICKQADPGHNRSLPADEAAGDIVLFQAGGIAVALPEWVKLAAGSAVPDAGRWGGETPARNVSPPRRSTRINEARAAGSNACVTPRRVRRELPRALEHYRATYRP